MATNDAPKEATSICVACHNKVLSCESFYRLSDGVVVHRDCFPWWYAHLHDLQAEGDDNHGDYANEL